MGNKMLDEIFGMMGVEVKPEAEAEPTTGPVEKAKSERGTEPEAKKEALVTPGLENADMQKQNKPLPTREYMELNSEKLVYAENPYRPYDGDDFQALVDDIAVNGVLEPIIVRDLGDGSPFQILAGSNRNRANIAAGNQRIPAVVVRNITDDEAKIITVGTNRLTRDEDKLLPSERAFAYKMLHDAEIALRREAKRSGRLLGDNIGEILEEKGNTSKTVFYRYISLTSLTDDLLNMVDEGRIHVKAGAFLSQMDGKSQKMVSSAMEQFNEIKMDERKAIKIAELYEEDNITQIKIENILLGKKMAPVAKVSIKEDILADLYPGEKKKAIEGRVEAAVLFKEKTLPMLFRKFDIEVQDDEDIAEILTEALDVYFKDSAPRYKKIEPTVSSMEEHEAEEFADDEHL